MRRIAALLGKEFADLRRNAGLFFPALLTAAITLVLPFVVALVIPAVTGERLSESNDFQQAIAAYGADFGRTADPEAAIQSWLFQQFLPLLILAPVAGSMSIAAFSVVGEKQARTLEPLLATPITTTELLVAKVLGAFLPAVGLTFVCFGIYLASVAAIAAPGAYHGLLTPNALGITFLLGPLAALAALQLAVCVSSRVNDARTAQQIGVFVILPIGGLLVGQLSGRVQLSTGAILLSSAILLVIDAAIARVAVALFDRESILTRWK